MMRKIVYNKLVRDKIPEIIEASGKKVKYRILTDKQELLNAFADKIIEEANELKAAINGDGNPVEEYWDVQDALMGIQDYLELDVELWHQKFLGKGVFDKCIFLESVEE